MKLRLRSMEMRGGGGVAAETHRVEVPTSATLADVRALLAAKLSATQPVPAESFRFSLNRSEELVSPDPAATLLDLGLTPGDLVYFTLSPLWVPTPTPPAQAPARNPSPGSASIAKAADLGKSTDPPGGAGSSSAEMNAMEVNPSPGSASIAKAADLGKSTDPLGGAGGSSAQMDAMEVNPGVPMPSDRADVVMVEAVETTNVWSSFVLKVLKREMENVAGAEGTVIGRLVAALHAALVDIGFTTTNPMASPLPLLLDWPSGAPEPLIIKYTVPKFVPMLPVAEEGRLAVLNISVMGNFIMVYGHAPGAQSEVCRLCLELPKLEPLLYLDSDQLGRGHEREILELWRVLKDEICLPLMISFCQLNSLPLPPCLISLPAELKTKILEFLPGLDLARVQCTCKELRHLAGDENLWKKFVNGEGSSGSKSAKARFAEAWAANKRRQKRPSPNFWNYGWGSPPPVPSHRFPVIGGDSDRLPFVGNHGSLGRGFGNHRRNVSPDCKLNGGGLNFF